jgi:protein-disulfide isomerase
VVSASVQEGTQLGIQGTPALYINGYKIDGALPPEEISLAIDRALQDAGVAVPAAAPATAAATAK